MAGNSQTTDSNDQIYLELGKVSFSLQKSEALEVVPQLLNVVNGGYAPIQIGDVEIKVKPIFPGIWVVLKIEDEWIATISRLRLGGITDIVGKASGYRYY